VRAARAVFPPEEVAQLKAIACELPKDEGVPLSRFTRSELHRFVIERGVSEASASTIGRSERKGGIEPFDRLVWQVMTKEPYASAPRVFWIVDNGSDHRGQASIDRLEGRWPNLILVHLPVHASWLNQVEIYHSIIQRKLLDPNDFESTAELARALNAFEHHCNQIAEPFAWDFTRQDLAELLARLDEPAREQRAPLALAA
jgi:hypothetical protein